MGAIRRIALRMWMPFSQDAGAEKALLHGTEASRSLQRRRGLAAMPTSMQKVEGRAGQVGDEAPLLVSPVRKHRALEPLKQRRRSFLPGQSGPPPLRRAEPACIHRGSPRARRTGACRCRIRS